MRIKLIIVAARSRVIILLHLSLLTRNFLKIFAISPIFVEPPKGTLNAQQVQYSHTLDLLPKRHLEH